MEILTEACILKKKMGNEIGKQLFSLQRWDEMDTMSFQFYDCVLKVGIGDYSAGTKVSGIFMDYENGVMDFYNDDGDAVIETFKMSLKMEVA